MKAVALPPGEAPQSADVEPPEEDQSGLPPLDADKDVTELANESPWAQLMNMRVLDVGPLTKATSPKGVDVCRTKLITTGGSFWYDLHNVRENGNVYIRGHLR
ncbi:MAG: hypothetical protein JO227_20805 [Acetobacteraceae bacterium]|nr:hypothetical protein [Acetobacteraceae bacterium]